MVDVQPTFQTDGKVWMPVLSLSEIVKRIILDSKTILWNSAKLKWKTLQMNHLIGRVYLPNKPKTELFSLVGGVGMALQQSKRFRFRKTRSATFLTGGGAMFEMLRRKRLTGIAAILE